MNHIKNLLIGIAMGLIAGIALALPFIISAFLLIPHFTGA
tara:strand:- start:167 stop:286 length:120 start_codon:yes stop_codon:yes gene_type:complete